MSEVERSEKRQPEPEDVSDRQKAKGIGMAMRDQIPTNGNGLGTVGEELIKRSLKADHDDEPERHLAWFNQAWRRIIRRGNNDPNFVVALEAAADAQLRRFARKAALKASWAYAALAGPAAYWLMNHFSDTAKWITDHVPLLRAIIKLIMESGT